MDSSLDAEVSQGKILATLSSMKKGKIPSLNGITVEFYLGFYDLLKSLSLDGSLWNFI
jgi:hypothetical protein